MMIAGLMVAGCDSAKENPAQKSAMAAKPQAPMAAEKTMTTASYQQGMKYLKAGQVNEAVQSFAKAIHENPKDPEPYVVLGQIYIRMKNYHDAVQAFTAASRVAPDRGDIYYLLALSYGFSGQRGLAKDSAQKSVTLFSEQKDQQNFARSLALLQSLNRADEKGPASVASTE